MPVMLGGCGEFRESLAAPLSDRRRTTALNALWSELESSEHAQVVGSNSSNARDPFPNLGRLKGPKATEKMRYFCEVLDVW